ncbi:hypothetical protein AJ80_01820 [Polytolypa hystricis UAMH7299]|uniref:Altered inheritance of mitochondria protein 9, mitochondrial n=1 Tax=Polytolypa hystricis (strain UAMH7299) TaxID=1447883 RepID=A0A2B7YXW3_POLH7|nr:hypothetical protein AJ80_01820 [Polytolypa hystricis UAMH7299]
MSVSPHGILTGRASEDDLFAYRAQRWLWNESKQLQRRHIKFDVQNLIKVAEEAAGRAAVCTNITRLPEGNFNKVFLASMKDGRQLIVKIPNPNAGRPHYTTASEAATMDYLKSILNIPVPRILAYYCSRAKESKLGAEYIIMEKAPGIELGRVWDSLKGRDKANIAKQLGDLTARLSSARFASYGSLYYGRDLADDESRSIDVTFVVGPTTARGWFDDVRDEMDVHRGPWTSSGEVMDALVQREIACLNAFSSFPTDRQHGIFNGPDGYRPAHNAKVKVLRDFQKICLHILPKRESLNEGII